VFSRQGLPTLDRARFGPANGLARGAYVLSDPEKGAPRAILIATGAEVHLALQAQKELAAQGIGVRVVSMPSWELFEEQDEDWREAVLPPALKARVSIEAASTFGWSRWIGDEGVAIGLDRFGASAPASELFEQLGLTVERTVRTVRTLLGNEVLTRLLS
jgi:transketolase